MRIRVLSLGGTISMTRALAPAGPGAAPMLGPDDLLGAVPSLEGVTVETEEVARLDSSDLGFVHCYETLRLASQAVGDGVDGVVVVQGTDTLEETAYVWDLLWPHSAPFVVTGAMRPSDAAGADGPANLLAALRVAASPAVRDQGVLVVLADEIHAARHVAKRHASSPAAFVSPDVGPLGRVGESVPMLDVRVPRRTPLPLPTREGRVGLVRASLGDDPGFYRAALEHADALVVEGFGAGQVGPGVASVLLEAAPRTPVVLASRTGAGAVATRTYTGPGSGTELVAGGVLAAGRLDGLKARVLLHLAMCRESTPHAGELAALFAEHGS